MKRLTSCLLVFVLLLGMLPSALAAEGNAAAPPEKIDEFMKLAADRDVEATILGKFTDDGKFRMMYGDKTVACLDIKFMHEGLPRLRLNAKWKAPKFAEPDLKGRDVEKDLLGLLAKLNICSCEYKARQYDHEVKGLSVVKPFVGRERDVQGDASVFMVEPLGREGAVLSYGILPRYSDIDCYHMMASVIDLAIRRAVAVGARVDMISGLDNFCWPDPVQSEKTPDGEYKMAQLVRANKGLYDYTCAFNVPCISGKDSMKIAVAGNETRMLLLAAYDNLGKGASGAAIECMNLVTGAEKTLGLEL